MASGTEIFRLFGSIFIDTTEADKSLSKTDSKAKKLQDTLGKAVTGAAKMATGVVASISAAGAAVFAFADNVASVGDTIDKQSQKLGLSAKGYQEWEAVLGHCGASIDSFKGGMKTLTSAITTGSKSQVAAFKAVGLSMEQVQSMSREDVLNAVITGLQGMDESAERTSIATTLLGKAAGELGPLLNTSAEDTAAMKQAVNELGGVMSDEGVAASAAFKDALQDLTTIGTGLKNALGTQVLPYVTEAMTALTDGFRQDGIAGMELAAADIVSGFTAKFAEKIPDIAAQATSAAQNFATYLQDNMPLIVECGGQIITNLANGIFDAFPSIAEAGIQTVATLVAEIWSHADDILTTGADLLGKLIGGLISVLGDLIDAADEIASAIVTKIMSTDWAQVGRDVVNGIARGIQNALPNLTGPLNKLSYKLNHALGKDGYAEYDTYEDWAKANGISTGSSGSGKYQQGSQKDDSYWKRYSDKLANQYGLNGSGASGSSGSSGGTTNATTTGSSGRSTKSSNTETVIKSLTAYATTASQNALGAVTTTTETLTETIKNSLSGVYDRVTETVTETGKELVNGVETTYKKVETRVNGTVTKVTKTYDDMSKTLLGTFTNVSETTFNGITTKVQQAVEKYADGSEHIKKTVTETGQRIGENGAETYEKIITYIDGVKDKVTETSNEIDKSVKGTQNRIDQQLSEASGQLDKGIFGLVKSAFTDAKNGNWSGLALDFVNLIWGEVSQEQRDVISKWLTDALTAVNEGYFSGGIGKALGSIQSIFTNGITAGVDGATTSVKAFSEIVQGLAGSGGVGGALGGIVQSFSGMAGGITSALGGIVSFIMSNPVLALILGVGAVAGGIGLAAWMNRKSDQQAVSHYESPFDKTGIYDSLSEFSTRAAQEYRATTYAGAKWQDSTSDRQLSILEKIEGLLDEHLPAIGTGQVVMDSGELVGALAPRMATNVDARIGVTVERKARGV